MAKTEIIYGIHAVKHALEQSAEDIIEIWVQESKRSAKQLEWLIQLSDNASLPIQYVSRQTLDTHTNNEHHQGVLIKCRSSRSTLDLASLLATDNDTTPLYLVLDGIQDPHNLGACLRTADAAGVKAVIIPKDRAVGLNATVRKVASGAAENIPVVQVTNLARSLREMQEAGLWIIGMADGAEQSIYEQDFNRPLAIVLGAEGKGLRHNTRKHCDTLVSIPMQGKVESLNVSVATGVCLFEVMRQRRN